MSAPVLVFRNRTPVTPRRARRSPAMLKMHWLESRYPKSGAFVEGILDEIIARIANEDDPAPVRHPGDIFA